MFHIMLAKRVTYCLISAFVALAAPAIGESGSLEFPSVLSSVSTSTVPSFIPLKQTVATARNDPNHQPFPQGTDEIAQAINGHLDATILSEDNIEILQQNPDAIALPTTDPGSTECEMAINTSALPSRDDNGLVGPAGPVPNSYTYKLSQAPSIPLSGGSWKVFDTSVFPVANTIVCALVTVEPGAIRELHWHPTQAEWSYFITGTARMTLFAGSSSARTFDYQAGDIGMLF
ncbi:oxalate decarboxylase [Sanghuangporus baumii]|uniref:Oxalate decarboxylase n=1 Tax=Sanghuangporus baumii TaxID=108892 RepID=A0A9Q5N4Y6_SANBA|nr:oxalate decarboxylase [Sanghuangporus baumii]